MHYSHSFFSPLLFYQEYYFDKLMPFLVGGATTASKSQKVPVRKMVRTDSSDPAGRLHAYMQVKPSTQLERNASLNSVRWDFTDAALLLL